MISGYSNSVYASNQTQRASDVARVQPNQNNRFSENPPIKQLSAEEAERAMATIKSNIEGWDYVDMPPRQKWDENIDPRDWSNPKRTMQERWNQRIFDTDMMLAFLGKFHTEYFSYEVDGIPVAVIAMDNNHITKLVAHPGSEGAGGESYRARR